MNKNLLYALILALVLGVWLLSGLFLEADEEPQSVVNERHSLTDVLVTDSTAQQFQPSMTFNARTAPFRTVNLSVQTSSTVDAIYVEEGQFVHQGQLLARLDKENRKQRLAEAESSLEQAELNYSGGKTIFEQKLISPSELSRLKAARESAHAAYETARIELVRTNIRATIPGYFNRRLLSKGEFAQRGQVYAQVIRLNPIKAVFSVSANEIQNLDQNQPVTLTLGSGETLTGKFFYRSAQAEPQSRLFLIEAVFDNPDNKVLADLTGRVSVLTQSQLTHKLPSSLLSLGTDGKLRIKTVDENNRVQSHAVKVVADDEKQVWLTGLPKQITLITRGHEYVGSGEEVLPKKAESAL